MNRQAPYFDANANPYSTPEMLMQQLSLQENAAISKFQGRPETFPPGPGNISYTSSEWNSDASQVSSPSPVRDQLYRNAGQGRSSVLDLRTEYEKHRETKRQSHEQYMEIGYEDTLQSLASEALEKTFQDEIRKLMEEQIHAQNEENFRHRVKLMEIINKYQEKLSALQAQQASRREEFLRRESGKRLRKYEQSSTIRTSSTNLNGNTWPTSTEDSTAKDPPAASSSSTSSNAATSSNAFGSNWQSPKSPSFGSPSTGFSFGASSAASADAIASPSTGFSFGPSSTSSATANASPFSFGASSKSSATTITSPFSFGAASTSSAPTNAPPSTGFLFSASSAPTNASPCTGFSFGASTNTSQSAGLSFGASSTSSALTNAASPMVFYSSSSSPFSFTASSTSVFSSPSLLMIQPVFGGVGFAASPANTDQMNAEDSMAEDPVQSSAPSVPVFGQPSVSASPPGFAFGSTVPSPGASPFMFGGQQHQPAPQNPSPFQISGNLGGSFSSGSSGDEFRRKIVKINRNRNRKK